MPDTERSDDWSELAALIDSLLDTPPDERGAFIKELSAGDAGRRSELEALLAECEREPALLSVPAAERFAALFDDEPHFPEALSARYRLTRELGRGGMATVYLARDVKHGRDVAVKVVHPTVAAALGTDRFLSEIENVAQLQHPHIVPLYDSGEANGSLYYVMPYEAGLSLRQRLARDGPLAPEEVVLILRDVSDALAHAHARGIIHRDIKPDNVLLSGRHAMVSDFGVARAVAESSLRATVPIDSSSATVPTDSSVRPGRATSGAALGTPAYMAPEQIAADPQMDHRADIYAVGVLGYELLTGRPPFAGAARLDILAGHLTDLPAPLAKERADVPAPLADLVMRSLEKRPADRWQTADELVQRLESLEVTRRGSFRPDMSWRNRWSRMRIERLTDFPGSAVMADWSPAESRLAYHELAPGDPIFVADADGANAQRIFIAAPGLHSHYLSWSPDGRFLYFSHGLPPNEMDVWRVRATGGRPERITSHNARVGYPVPVDDRTLLYTTTDDDGTGPWLYMMDVEERVPIRLSAGVEHFVSIAASA